MADVYRGAFFTICAAASADSSKGIFTPRPPATAMNCRVPISWADGEGNAVLGHGFDGVKSEDEPINRRAWTLQERLLSWRAIVYGTDSLSWECQGRSIKAGSPGTMASDYRGEMWIQSRPSLS